jgi:hypothetical protein
MKHHTTSLPSFRRKNVTPDPDPGPEASRHPIWKPAFAGVTALGKVNQ